MGKSGLKKNDYFLLIFFAAIITPIILFVFRAVDDNRLTSWRCVFATVDEGDFFFVLLLGLALAFVLSRYISIERGRPFFLFLLSFGLAALFWGEPEVIVDAARYFSQAKHLKVYGEAFFLREWGRDVFAWTDMPLIPFIYGLAIKYLGETRIVAQVFTSALFAATSVITFFIGKTLWDESLGMHAGLLLLGFPYLFTQVPLMLVDVPTMFFLSLAIFTFIKALQTGGGKMICMASLCLFFACIVKYSTWLLLSVLAVIFLVQLQSNPGKVMRRAGWIALFSSVLIGLYLLSMHEVIIEQIRFLQSYQKPGLRRWGESYISTFFFQIHPFVSLAAIYSAYVAFRKRDPKYLIVSYLVVLIIILQIKRIRYTLPIFPMIALMASYGLREIRGDDVKRFLVFCLINSSIVTAFFAYLPFLQSMSCVNLHKAGLFLNSLAVDDVEVFTLPQARNIVNPSISVPLVDLSATGNIVHTEKTVSDAEREGVKTSPLRFTWEYKNPLYYKRREKSETSDAVVVISASPDQALPEDIAKKTERYTESKEFSETTGVFVYQTFVTVYY